MQKRTQVRTLATLRDQLRDILDEVYAYPGPEHKDRREWLWMQFRPLAEKAKHMAAHYEVHYEIVNEEPT